MRLYCPHDTVEHTTIAIVLAMLAGCVLKFTIVNSGIHTRINACPYNNSCLINFSLYWWSTLHKGQDQSLVMFTRVAAALRESAFCNSTAVPVRLEHTEIMICLLLY